MSGIDGQRTVRLAGAIGTKRPQVFIGCWIEEIELAFIDFGFRRARILGRLICILTLGICRDRKRDTAQYEEADGHGGSADRKAAREEVAHIGGATVGRRVADIVRHSLVGLEFGVLEAAKGLVVFERTHLTLPTIYSV